MYDKINCLRAAALARFQELIAAGKSPEETQVGMFEFSKALGQTLVSGVRGPLNECVAAIRAFENAAESHKKTAEFFEEKSRDEQEHADRLKSALAEHMKAQGVSQLVGDGCRVAIFLHESGAESVTVQ